MWKEAVTYRLAVAICPLGVPHHADAIYISFMERITEENSPYLEM
jgi:hypothetical protein